VAPPGHLGDLSAQPKVAVFNAPEAIGLSAAEAAELTRMLRIVRTRLS
jgi:hypothetical protein